jgi:hypothetical protein
MNAPRRAGATRDGTGWCHQIALPPAQDAHVLSIVCKAVFSDACSVSAQYDFTAIHILA